MKNKCDFKKLALLGIAGGTVLATQASASDVNNYSQLLAFNGCSGSSGCGGGRGMGGNSGNYQAYRSVPSQDYYYTNGQSSHCNSFSHCNGQSQYYPSYSGCNSTSAPQYYQPSHGCGASSSPQYYQPSHGCNSASVPQYYQPSHGCNASSSPQYYQNSQPSQGCNAPSVSQGQFNSQQRQSQPSSQPAPLQTQEAYNKVYTQWETSGFTADAGKLSTQRSMSESELLSQLNDQGKAAYQALDSSGKALALKLANQDCKGHNECKGLNSCKTEDHSCAGKGSCAGTAKSNFKDKNLAVKVAAVKMAEKRANAASSK